MICSLKTVANFIVYFLLIYYSYGFNKCLSLVFVFMAVDFYCFSGFLKLEGTIGFFIYILGYNYLGVYFGTYW